MRWFTAALSLACFMLASQGADASPKHARHSTRGVSLCVPDNNGRQVCGSSVYRIQRRATGHSDANGNAIGRHEEAVATARGYCHRQTAAGTIIVACGIADRMDGFIADVVARGFKGRVHCFATHGHVRNSLHYRGEACDFAQRGWGKTVRPMYRVADLAAKWGFRDGCTFRDCGHIDSGRTGWARR